MLLAARASQEPKMQEPREQRRDKQTTNHTVDKAQFNNTTEKGGRPGTAYYPTFWMCNKSMQGIAARRAGGRKVKPRVTERNSVAQGSGYITMEKEQRHAQTLPLDVKSA